MDKHIKLNKNKIVQALGKMPKDFTKEYIIKFVMENDIQMINFMYPAGDGRLKTLNFIINDLDYLETILTTGERVDGSSLFKFIEAGNSDLYAIPRYRTAFVDPFSELPTVTMLCSFFDKDGKPLDSSPVNTLAKACRSFTKVTGMEFHAMGELEYYVIGDKDERFPANDQRGYHESAPFAKFNDFRVKCMAYIAQAGGQIKYGHSEVGNFTHGDKIYEQNEIEFLPVPAEEAADQLMIAKWIIRNLAYSEGLDVTFAPKITTGKAGSGLHVHMRLMKDGKNMMVDEKNRLSNDAKKMISGLLELAPSLTAFGNTNPTSYFRLVPHQEAPTNICWGDRNRSVLVRVPLGWTSSEDMSAIANGTRSDSREKPSKQTVEIRSADGSADIYQLLAGLAVAARHGFEMENALENAERNYVNVNIHDKENEEKLKQLKQLPVNCADSASRLEEQRGIYEKDDVFSPRMIDGIEQKLKAYDDKELIEKAKKNDKLMEELVDKYFYCG